MRDIQKLSNPSIVFCVFMDLIGYASFAIPGLAEISDVIWAPISAFIFLKTFGGRIGRMGSVFNFIEEVLPFTDFIPSFTIAWFIRNGVPGKSKSLSVPRIMAK
ncbi:MAG: hypothetical protein ABIP80_06720 [Ferruginibacter sp.]